MSRSFKAVVLVAAAGLLLVIGAVGKRIQPAPARPAVVTQVRPPIEVSPNFKGDRALVVSANQLTQILEAYQIIARDAMSNDVKLTSEKKGNGPR